MAKSKKKSTRKPIKKTAKKAVKKAVAKKAVKKKVVAKKVVAKKAVTKKPAVKKAAKKAAAKKAPLKRSRLSLTENLGQPTIRFDARFFGGAGQVELSGQNLDKIFTATDFVTANQDRRFQTVFATGSAPSGPNGRIEVQVSQGSNVLSPFSQNVFTASTFNSNITYTVS